jgi:type II restriction/modification system DNA methylase subunit YeeA
MREFISYAVGCMLGRYSLDKPGLILANQGETADDYRQQIPEPTFAPDEDNVIPLLDGDWFTDDISLRFEEFLRVTFGTEHYDENLKFLEDALYPDNLTGKKRKTIRDYFLKEFYNHHLKIYKKRPIYWLFSSGKQGAFRALIYMHRYNPSTLSRMRTEYVVPLQGKFNSRIEQLESDIPAASSTSHRKILERERDKLIKQRDELRTFDDKLRHYADQRIELDLDDGVKVNYGKFGDLLAEVKAITGTKPKVTI